MTSPRSDTPEPRTEAGRALLAWDRGSPYADEQMRTILGGNRHWSMEDAIPLIEQEAAAAARAEVLREVREALTDDAMVRALMVLPPPSTMVEYAPRVRAAVLAILGASEAKP